VKRSYAVLGGVAALLMFVGGALAAFVSPDVRSDCNASVQAAMKAGEAQYRCDFAQPSRSVSITTMTDPNYTVKVVKVADVPVGVEVARSVVGK